jgi:hypothetical protein
MGGSSLVAASASARFSLGGAYTSGGGGSSPVIGPSAAPRATRGMRAGADMQIPLSSEHPNEEQLSPMQLPLRSLTLRAASASGGAALWSPFVSRNVEQRQVNSHPSPKQPPSQHTNSIVVLARQRVGHGLDAGDFPQASDADASADFVGHVKSQRKSGVLPDAGDKSGNDSNTYDVQSGPLLRAAIKCFSIQNNWPRLVSIAPLRSGELASMNGMRSVSMGLIILGQTIMSMLPVGFSNSHIFSPPNGLLSSWTFQAILSADFGVG